MGSSPELLRVPNEIRWFKPLEIPLRHPIQHRLRFAVSGHLPDALGEDPKGFNLHSNWSCATEDNEDDKQRMDGLSFGDFTKNSADI